MTNKVVSDTFETLGQIASQATSQTAVEPKKIAETAFEQMQGQGTGQVKQAAPIPFIPAKQVKEKEQKQEQAKKRLTYLQDELKMLKQKQAQEKVVEQKTEEKKAIQQIEIEKQKKEETPLALTQAKQKGGTGERRKMGSGV